MVQVSGLIASTLRTPWVYWSAMQLHDPTAGDAGEGLLNQQTRRPVPGLARAVAVPYAWATGGVPGSQAYDRATRVFRYGYRVDPAVDAPTLIDVPTYTYPSGYATTVTGGRVVSRRNAPLLELRATPRAAQVSVTVRPRRQRP